MINELFLKWHAAVPEEVAPGVRVLVKLGDALEVGKIFVKAGTELKCHAHSEEQMFYVIQGRLRYTVGVIEDVAEAGDLIFFPRDVTHWGCVEGVEDAVFIEIKERHANQMDIQK